MKTSVLNVAMRLPLWVAGLAIAGSAHSATKSTLDLTAGVGASTNPQLQIGGRSSAFGRISALGTHEWRSERTTICNCGLVDAPTPAVRSSVDLVALWADPAIASPATHNGSRIATLRTEVFIMAPPECRHSRLEEYPARLAATYRRARR